MIKLSVAGFNPRKNGPASRPVRTVPAQFSLPREVARELLSADAHGQEIAVLIGGVAYPASVIYNTP